jgi:hypothetical protein
MDDDIADCGLDLAQINARDVVTHLRQVVVDRRRLMGQARLGHRTVALHCHPAM